MKKLEEFVSEINEGRRPGSKNKSKNIDVPGAPDIDKIDGKPAKRNGSDGEFGLNEPKDAEAKKIEDQIDLDNPNNTKSVKQLIAKFDAEEDFFIQGRAGWGKTTIIEKLARQYGYQVLTVYLDKSDAEELGGYNVPVEANKSKAKVKDELGHTVEREFAATIKALPSWAKVMLDNPDINFLLFFDEMNQAEARCMNALMPIVLNHRICGIDFNNFFVGAAGNLIEENEGGVEELAGPLLSRLKPIIMWDCDWKETFNYLHKTWDNKFGKEFVDQFEAAALDGVFDNPREIERQIFKFVYKLKNKGDAIAKRIDPEVYLDRLKGIASQDISRTNIDKVLPKLADAMVECIKGKISNSSEGSTEDSNSGRSRGKGKDMIPDEIKNIIKHGITRGYIELDGDDHKYGISKENITKAITSACESEENDNDEQLNAEMVQMYIDKLEEDGIKYKYQKDDEWKKEKLSDPLKALIINKHTKAKQEKEIEKPNNKVRRYDNR